MKLCGYVVHKTIDFSIVLYYNYSKKEIKGVIV
jgi:hypothetical protein